MFFFDVLYVFLHICSIGLMGFKRAYQYLKNPKKKEHFLSKINSILTRKQFDFGSGFYGRWFSF
jgi:hypothetical protein